MSKRVPEATARRLKSEYYELKMKELKNSTDCDNQANDENTASVVKSLPAKAQGRPLLLGKTG